MKTHLASSAVVCALLAAASLAGDLGSPLVAVGHVQPVSWTQALNNGLIRALDPATDGVPGPDERFYATQGTAAFVASALTPDLMIEMDGAILPGLVMQWNPLMQGEDIAVASFELDLRPDPGRAGGIDARNGEILFSLAAPPGVWDIGLTLQDGNGNWAGWFMPMPELGWSNQEIDLTMGNQGGWQSFADPGFDLSNVVALRLNEAGAMVSFPLPPDGAQPGFGDWNAFGFIIITPTPGATGLAGIAMLCALRRRRAA